MKTTRFLAQAIILKLSFLGILSTLAGEPADTRPQPIAPIRIATVDMQQLFKEYYRTNDAQKQINIERARIQKENNDRLTRIRELENNLSTLRKQIEDPAISDTKKQTLFKDWQMQQQEGIALDRERREFLQRKNQALNETMVQRMKGILNEIRKLVEEQAKGENYDYVFDKSGLSTSQVPFLLYTKDATDITAVLLKDLNKDVPKEASPTESTGGDATLFNSGK